ncbi:hypothetical protein KKK_11305 [Pseudomonas putida B6-2]|nr:hypothetical protein KKK_11305 [Pseudomonas putida B6-2]
MIEMHMTVYPTRRDVAPLGINLHITHGQFNRQCYDTTSPDADVASKLISSRDYPCVSDNYVKRTHFNL